MENSMKVSQKIKNRIIVWSSNPTLGYLAKKIEIRIQKKSALPASLNHYSQQPRHGNNPNIHQQVTDKENVVYHTMEYYSVFKKKGILGLLWRSSG